jgi:hypothetical protein
MTKLSLNGRSLTYQHVASIVTDKGVPEEHLKTAFHTFERYDADFNYRLNLLYNNVPSTHILVLFDPQDISRVLKHINIFGTFTFTLVPETISFDVYQQIYRFFMTDPQSITFITWFSKLILRPWRELHTLRFGGTEIAYKPCDPACPLRAKLCSKQLLFTELFHPMKELPTDDDFELFCDIHRHFSVRIARDYVNDDLMLDNLQRFREESGMRNQFWIDPQELYTPHTDSSACDTQSPAEPLHDAQCELTSKVLSFVDSLKGKVISNKAAAITTQAIGCLYSKSTPTVELALTAGDVTHYGVNLYRFDEREDETLTRNSLFYRFIDDVLRTVLPQADLICPASNFANIDREAKALCDTDPVSMFKLDFGPPPNTIERVSMYYRFGPGMTDIRTFADALEATSLFGPIDKKMLVRMKPYLVGDFDSGFTVKVRPHNGETVLRVMGSTTYEEALSFASTILGPNLNPRIFCCNALLRKMFGTRLSRVSLSIDLSSSHPDTKKLFSIEVPDVLGREIIQLTSHFMPDAVDNETERLKHLCGEDWRDKLFDYVKIRPMAKEISIKYYLSSDYALNMGDSEWTKQLR